MANPFDSQVVLHGSFAFKDLIGQDGWTIWTPDYSFTTATSLVVSGRYRIVGRQCFWQVKSTGTSLATTAGTSYISFPITALGLGGYGTMQNATTKIAVGTGPIIVADNKFYPPTQGASANNFLFSGWYEV